MGTIMDTEKKLLFYVRNYFKRNLTFSANEKLLEYRKDVLDI
jgi:hypothetical protein